VSDSAGDISVYAPGQTTPSRKITPAPSEFFDDFVATRSGKLYVAKGEGGFAQASLLEYAVGGSQPVNILGLRPRLAAAQTIQCRVSSRSRN
jgi:hypothetical protein